MYAIIETGGKQYRVQEGDVITVEKLKVIAEDRIEFDRVLAYSDGATVTIGAPIVETAKVYGTVIENGKAEKVIIFKYKSKKDYRKKQGHRQPYTMVRIVAIAAGDLEIDFDAKAAAAKSAAKQAKVKGSKPDTKPAVKKAEKVAAKKTEKVAQKAEKAVAKKAAKPAAKKTATKTAAKKTAADKADHPAAKKTVKKDK
jgi:large subunit ribosomal protein L21